MDLQEVGFGGMDCIDLAQYRDRWRALVHLCIAFTEPRLYSLIEIGQCISFRLALSSLQSTSYIFFLVQNLLLYLLYPVH